MPATKPTVADFLAANRGGGLFTMQVNQRVGAVLAYLGHRMRLAPTELTLINLACGLAISAVVVLAAPAMAEGSVSSALIGVIALLVWQFAYSLDCSDGQLARVTGRGSAAGARIDILADIAQQTAVVAATAAVAVAYEPATPTWLIAAFGGLWMTNLVTSVMGKSDQGDSLITSGSLVVQVVKLVRDYGAVITLISLVIAFAPQWTVWVVVLFTAVNGGFLALSILKTARDSLKAPAIKE